MDSLERISLVGLTGLATAVGVEKFLGNSYPLLGYSSGYEATYEQEYSNDRHAINQRTAPDILSSDVVRSLVQRCDGTPYTIVINNIPADENFSVTAEDHSNKDTFSYNPYSGFTYTVSSKTVDDEGRSRKEMEIYQDTNLDGRIERYQHHVFILDHPVPLAQYSATELARHPDLQEDFTFFLKGIYARDSSLSQVAMCE